MGGKQCYGENDVTLSDWATIREGSQSWKYGGLIGTFENDQWFSVSTNSTWGHLDVCLEVIWAQGGGHCKNGKIT